ncbi:response regulator [Paenibacillus sp. DMB20]|uniref:response regulator n=1 Tax=Paenibacillus sp. DMB20 TaxID=1642570 RepID=UPI00062828A2|nr:response regulator [Paenibacillus sp. DMB20]KKO51065.1 response regulator receiver protein [Paenibacillus sp. DMB20]
MVFKAMVVDDEKLGLMKLTKLLKDQPNEDIQVEIVGAFQNPLDALKAAEREVVHLAFLDIEMPEMSGFELAERLLQLRPHVRIIFVTAYQEHAVKAFELNALDYLLKPVHQIRLERTLLRAAEFLSVPAPLNSKRMAAKLCCMNRLRYIDADGNEQAFVWKTLKAPELFAYLVYHRDKTVFKQTLIDLLWPGYDEDKATAQLYTAIYQIRKVIKTAGLDLEIKYKDEGYQLVWGDLKLDLDEWKKAIAEAPEVTPDTLSLHHSIKALYTGNFLEEHRYIWAEHEQERNLLIWSDHVRKMAECCVSVKNYTEAILLYQEIKERAPDMEEGYFGLMIIHASLNHPGEVRKQYQLISDRLLEEFDVEPSKKLKSWYSKWSADL